MKRINLLAFTLFLVLLSSCSQSSDTAINGGGPAVAWTIPSVGTAYVFQSNTPISTKPGFDTVTILQTGQHLGGKTGVIGCEDQDGSAGTFFYNIEQNGDLSYGDSSIDTTGAYTYTWKTFPTGSHQPIADPAVDTIESVFHIIRSDVRSFVGAETLATAAGSLSTLHVRETAINIVSAPDSLDCNENDTGITDTWFAPSLGIYVKVADNGTDDGVVGPQSEVDLIKYLPK